MNRLLGALLVLFAVSGCALPKQGAFSFAVIGDLQYTAEEEALFPALIDAMNRESLAFVVHVGDFKPGSRSVCSDELFRRRHAEFNRSHHPLVYTPGDNEWVDCRRSTNGSMDPQERLDKLREIFFADEHSLGMRTMPVERPATRYRENALWTAGNVVFATVNIQGSNDNLGFDAANDREHAQRTAQNIAWMQRAAQRAAQPGMRALVLFQQANPGFEVDPDSPRTDGYGEYLAAFEATAQALGKPVLFVHGDSHTYRVEPYRGPTSGKQLPMVTRLESVGTPHVDWVRVDVDPDNDAAPFVIRRGGFVAPAKAH